MSVLTSPVPLVPLAPPPPADGWPIGVQGPPTNLPETDGEPLESNWQRDAMNLVIELVRFLFVGRTDFFVGGNMFIYFSAQQARNTDFKGPDVFFAKGVDGTRDRKYWAIWDENGRYPNWILELLSPTTAHSDRTVKKNVYEQTFRTPEYFLYDPETEKLEGWRLDANQLYQAIVPDQRGWMWSEQLRVWLGTWKGKFQENLVHVWLRFYTADGKLVPLFAEHQAALAGQEKERAEKEKERAEKEKERAERGEERAAKAEADLARLKVLFAEKGLSPPTEDTLP